MAGNSDLNQYIDERLRDYRPDRYQAGDPFFERVVDAIPDDFYDQAELMRRIKRADVAEREKRARRTANNLLREFHTTGQLDLHWRITANEPLAISATSVDDEGNETTRREYVTLRAVTPVDLREWANNEESAAQEDLDKRMAAVSGARDLAVAVSAAGFDKFHQWAEFVSPDQDQAESAA